MMTTNNNSLPEYVVGGVPVDTRDQARLGLLYTPPPGAIQAPCNWCGILCWVGLRGQELLAKGTPLICPGCTVALSGDNEVQINNLGGQSGTVHPIPKEEG